MNTLLKLSDSKSNPTAAPPARDNDEMKLAEKMFSAHVEEAKLNSPEDIVSNIEISDIIVHNFGQQTPVPQAKSGELLTELPGPSQFPDVAPTIAENGRHLTLDIGAGTSAIETPRRPPQTLTTQGATAKKAIPAQIPLQSLGLDIEGRQDVKPNKSTTGVSTLKESLQKTPIDVAIEIKPTPHPRGQITKAAMEPLTLTRINTTSAVETSTPPLQTLAAQSITSNKANPVQTPVKSLILDIKDRSDVKTGKPALDIPALKESLPRASTDTAIETKPNSQAVTEIAKTTAEPPTLLGAVTTSTIGTSTRIPQSLNVATSLPTSHPAIQAVAQNLVKVQETQSGVTVRLDPPEMGRVFIDFQFDAERNVTAIVRSEVVETSIALKDKAEFFQQILKENGFNTVTLNFQQNDTSKQNAFGQNSNAQNFSSLVPEIEELAEVPPPVARYELSHETAIDIKL